MTVTWSIASGIILHHRSNAYELFLYWFSLIYFSVATVTITTKYQKYYFSFLYFCYRYHYYHITLLLNTLLQILSYLGVVELTTQLLILEYILWLPLYRINKFGLNTVPLKTVALPYTCGLSPVIATVNRWNPLAWLGVVWALMFLLIHACLWCLLLLRVESGLIHRGWIGMWWTCPTVES